MASFGVSLDDATKASTVSAAFRRAVASKGSAIKAIDELTSRLHLANLTHRSEALRPHFTTASSHNNVVADPEQNNPSTDTLATPPPNQFLTAEGRKVPLRSKVGDKQTPHKGKKRALSDKGNEKLSTSNTTLEAKAADVEVKAKISKEDEKKAKDLSGRSKSAAPAGGRGKRPSLRSDEGQPVKRVRSTSTI
ncbi:hypothetical protein HJC23_000527 [Cyclotella cryptica]|uniref:Uncharacterized protein n=1 Tax=Cyclotella cryptica TaxID=29204 RepID=A0ABD3NU23_9STRA